MDFLTITRAEIISAISALVALLSASYTWRNYRISARKERREIEATKPVIEIHPSQFENNSGWDMVHLTLRNRYPHTIILKKISLISPGNGEIGIFKGTGWGNFEPSGEFITFPKGFFCPYEVFARPAGSNNAKVSTSFILRRLPRHEFYSLRLNLEEPLAEIRRSTITVKIKVPALKASAPNETQSARDI